MAKRKTAPADAQLGYRFTGPLPAKPKRGSGLGLTADFLARVVALFQAGWLDGFVERIWPGQKKRRGAANRRGVDLAQIMVLIAQYGPQIQALVELFGKYFKKTDKPVVDTGGEEPEPDEEPDLGDGEPTTPALREAVDFGQAPHWFTRKKAMTPNSGRKLGSDREKLEIWRGDDPSMQGDRWCVDHTPRDAQGRPFLPGQAENSTITWKFEGLGIAEIQTQEEVDFTPTFLVPWQGLEMDHKYEAGIRSTMFVNGKAVKTREHTIRVHTRGLD